MVLDPTLLLTAKEWDDVLGLESKENTQDKYLLYYNLKKDSFDDDAVKKFAVSMGLKLVVLFGKAEVMDSYDIRTTCNPRDFVELIKKASFVLTSSYHGLVFSILYNKPFYASFSVGPDRASSILNSLGICDKLIEPMVKRLPEYTSIDYTIVDKHLIDLRLDSLEYIRKALS